MSPDQDQGNAQAERFFKAVGQLIVEVRLLREQVHDLNQSLKGATGELNLGTLAKGVLGKFFGGGVEEKPRRR